MKKGQIFAMDFFIAYVIFLLVMLFMTATMLSIAGSMNNKIKIDDMTKRSLSGLDYLCYGENFSYEPYHLKKDSIDWFFSQTDEEISNTLLPGWNYSLKLNDINGANIHTAGSQSFTADQSLSFERVVYYNEERGKLVMAIWDEK